MSTQGMEGCNYSDAELAPKRQRKARSPAPLISTTLLDSSSFSELELKIITVVSQRNNACNMLAQDSRPITLLCSTSSVYFMRS